ncbi:DUF2905 domain-containing protein [Schnuerera sp. xch1]|uniref:DUF2905 domain-containing protein n=1 Tax=Schnuerera sp. xch1 TaxID=2874283 RepID=UPI001CBFFBD8|nr:DUF2905 domain-containing protein [Schnuerera sp. xch1]
MRELNSLGKVILTIGGVLVVLGLIVMVGERFGLGKLPGDIFIKKGNFTFFFPIVSSVILSLILTLLLNLFKR